MLWNFAKLFFIHLNFAKSDDQNLAKVALDFAKIPYIGKSNFEFVAALTPAQL
jgi:hypothetical protein